MSLRKMYDGGVDHDSTRIEDLIERYQPSVPPWHRGVCWPVEVQRKFVESWMAGDVNVCLSLGKAARGEGDRVFLDGLNSFHAVRQAFAGKLGTSLLFEQRRAKQSFFDRMIHVDTYIGTPEELARVTYLLNRGSPLPWSKEQLPR